MSYIKKEPLCAWLSYMCVSENIIKAIENDSRFPPADVVPRAEVEALEAKLAQCQLDLHYSVCREDDAIARTARKIFEEIYEDCFDQFGYINYEALADLKKKHTGEER